MTRDDDDVASGVTAPHAAGPASPEVGSVHVLIEPTVVHVVLTGEIDASAGTDLSTAATEALESNLPVEVDCRYVTFMDSTGVGFLARLAARSQRRVRLLNPPPMVRFLLDTVRISNLVEIVHDDPEPPPAGGEALKAS